MPIKPLSFKGDKKPHSKKRKLHSDAPLPSSDPSSGGALIVATSGAPNPNATNEPADSGGDDDDAWVSCDLPSDLSGPTLLVLPTSPPTALASDALGNVFASPLENVVDGDPATAEPHEVRQVWIATRIAGTGDQVSFKGSHGKYLGCDGVSGILSARKEAIGREEDFLPVVAMQQGEGGERSVGGMFALKTAASGSSSSNSSSGTITISSPGEGEEKGGGDRFICVTGGGVEDINGEDADADEHQDTPTTTTTKKAPRKSTSKTTIISIRGDGDGISHLTTLRIRMQARFKPQLRRNKETRAKEKISRRELEQAVGRRLDDDEVRRLKRARRHGTYHEEILDVRVKGKHDKFAS